MQQPTSVTLANNAVTLVPMTMDHLQDFYQAGKDQRIWQWTPPYRLKTLNEAEKWLTESLAIAATGEHIMFAIIDNASGSLVGSTRYCSIDVVNSGIEIGFTFINPKFQRSHINSNSKLLLLTHAFETLGAKRVQLKTHEKNQKSRNAISRLGTTFEGILRNQLLLSTGEYRNTAMFSLLDDEWPQAKLRLQEKIEHHLHSQQDKSNVKAEKQLSKPVVAMINEYPLAQVMIASNDNLHEQIIYIPLLLDQEKRVLSGHLASINKLAWLLENSPNVTVVFQGDDLYVSPLLHEKIKVPTWNYRRLHISGQFSFLPAEQNKQQIRLQVEALEAQQWSMDDQPEQMINNMLANIRCFEINIERVDTVLKLSQEKPLAIKEAIASQLNKMGKTSLADAHLNGDKA